LIQHFYERYIEESLRKLAIFMPVSIIEEKCKESRVRRFWQKKYRNRVNEKLAAEAGYNRQLFPDT